MLLRQYLRREAGGLFGWAISIPVLVLPLIGVYRLMANSESMRELNRMIEQLPDAVKSMVGGTYPLSTFDAWMQAQVFGFLVPLVLTIFTALAALGVLTREMDGRTMDFLLALPLRRSNVLLSRLGGVVLNLVFLHAVLLASIGAGVLLLGEEPAWAKYTLILLNQFLIFAALASLLVLITVFLDDYQKGLMAVLGVALVMFFLPHVIPQQSPLADLARLSLFHYYRPAEVLVHSRLPWADVALLLGVVLGGSGAAVWLFNRKQLTA